MSVIKPFSEVKCNKCNKDGFIINENNAVKCDCRKQYEFEVSASESLLKGGLLKESSSYEDFKKLINFDWSDYRGKDENGNLKKLQKFVDDFDKVKYKEVPHDSVDDKGNVIRTEYTKISVESPFKHLHCYVYGEQGTQKSYTIKGMLTKLACKGKSVFYIFTKDLIAIINDSERNEESQKLLDYILNVDVLVLEEFNEERCALWQSGYKEKNLIIWIKNRLEIIRKSTWFVTNDTIERLKEGKFGELFGDLIDRETRFGRFHFTDRYVDNLDEKEIENMMKNIWD